MIIVMRQGAAKKELNEVLKRIRDLGYKTHIIHGVERDVIGAIGDERGKARLQSLESLAGVEKVVPILKPFKLASREIKTEPTVIDVGGVKIGGAGFVVIAGPCSVESREQLIETATAVKKAGAHILRGGADGIMVEVHCRPEEAVSDGLQSLKPEKFRELMREINPFVRAAGRTLS